jgi:hypothetical protein
MEMQYHKLEQSAGDDQLLVLFVNQDTAEMVDPSAFLQALSEDAAARRPKGWRLVSVSAMPLRQTGTLGNVFWQTGGQYATQAGLLAIYSSAPTSDDATVAGTATPQVSTTASVHELTT